MHRAHLTCTVLPHKLLEGSLGLSVIQGTGMSWTEDPAASRGRVALTLSTGRGALSISDAVRTYFGDCDIILDLEGHGMSFHCACTTISPIYAPKMRNTRAKTNQFEGALTRARVLTSTWWSVVK
jgi:hypothetical protein